MMNLTEGLQPWQPKKLYFATDAFENFTPYWHDEKQLSPFRKNIVDGTGPTYSTTEVSAAGHKSYAVLTAEQQKYYLTQEAYLGIDAFEKKDFTGFNYPVHLIFGKSLVGGIATGDVFERVTEKPISFAPVRGFEPKTQSSVAMELGGPWGFYREFWKVHSLEHLANLLPVPEASVKMGAVLNVPLIISNYTKTSEDVTLTPVLPEGWSDKGHYDIYPLKPGEHYPILETPIAPSTGGPRWEELTWKAEVQGHAVGTVSMRVYVSNEGSLPQ
jgi:hypothetical protein